MNEILSIHSEISIANEANDVRELSRLAVKMATGLATILAPEIADVEKQYASKYVEIATIRRETGIKASVDELNELRDETEIAERRTMLRRFYRSSEDTLGALRKRIDVLSKNFYEPEEISR